MLEEENYSTMPIFEMTSDDQNTRYDDATVSSSLLESSELSDRLLQDNSTSIDDNSNSTTGEATFAPTTVTPAETEAPGGKNNNKNIGLNNQAYSPDFATLVLVLVVVALIFGLWRWCRYLKIRREQYQLQVTSARADTVLGDMQVSTHE